MCVPYTRCRGYTSVVHAREVCQTYVGIDGTIVERHKFVYESCKNYAQLCNIYVIYLCKLHMNCTILNRPKFLRAQNQIQIKICWLRPSTEMTNTRITYKLQISPLYHKRPKLQTWTKCKLFVATV